VHFFWRLVIERQMRSPGVVKKHRLANRRKRLPAEALVSMLYAPPMPKAAPQPWELPVEVLVSM
jgi:hypothetical protein